MSNKPKLLFDECIGHPLVTQLIDVSVKFGPQEVDISHVIWLEFGGRNDDEWIPEIANENWVIITGDSGKRKKPGRGEKLPIVCAMYGVTYVTFSTAVNSCSSFHKLNVILNHWDRLLTLKDEPRGSGFQIRQTNSGRTVLELKTAPTS